MSPPPWKKDIFLGGDDDEQILISHTNKGTHSHVHSACPLHIFMIAEMTRWICIFCWWFWFQLIVQVLELKTIAHLSSWYLIAKMIILMVRCENYRYLILLMAKMIRKMDSWWWCWCTMYMLWNLLTEPQPTCSHYPKIPILVTSHHLQWFIRCSRSAK